MLCVSLKAYIRNCSGVSGGISDVAIADPSDFNFTQPSPVNGVSQAYSAVALRGAGTGAAATATLTSGGVSSVSVGTPGTGYSGAPTVVFSGGAGTGAAGTAIINGSGAVVAVNITAPGTGYTSAPTISFTGGGATYAGGGKVFMISSLVDQSQWTAKQSRKGCAVKYDHEIIFALPDNGQALTSYLETLDAASCCCGLLVFIKLNSGRILVAGEKYVNGSAITRFTVTQDGTEGDSGKLLDDPNQVTVHLKGSYSRNLYEYSGPWSDIEALM